MVLVQGRRYQGGWPHPVVLILLSSCCSFVVFNLFLLDAGASSDQGSSLLTTLMIQEPAVQQQQQHQDMSAVLSSELPNISTSKIATSEGGTNNPTPPATAGWHTIQVFYGDRNLLDTNKHVVQKSVAVGSTDGQQDQFKWFSQT
jgi:hypothetical protein